MISEKTYSNATQEIQVYDGTYSRTQYWKVSVQILNSTIIIILNAESFFESFLK